MNQVTAHAITLWCAIFAKFSKGLARELEPLKLTALQYRLLLELASCSPASVVALRLARTLTAKPVSVLSALESLDAHGFVRETTGDGRTTTKDLRQASLRSFACTPEGAACCEIARPGVEAFVEEVRAGVDAESWRLFMEMLFDALARPGSHFASLGWEGVRGQDLSLSLLLTAVDLFPQVVTTKAKKEIGVSLTELRFLLELYPKRPGVDKRLRAKDVALLLRTKRSFVTTTAVKLEEAGLVVREPDPDDARGVLLGLSHEGEFAVSRAGDDVAAAFESLFGAPSKSKTREMRLAKRLLMSIDAVLVDM